MKKIEWIENARTVALCSVILVHVAGQGVYSKSPVAPEQWVIAAFFESFRYGVPFFIMITGALLLGKNINYKEFYIRKVLKIVIPFIVFSLLYLVATFGIDNIIHEGFTNKLALYIYNGFKNGAFYHLWYIYLLMALYIITPFLQIIIRRFGKTFLHVFLIAWLLFIAVYGYCSGIFFERHLMPDFLGYIGYYILGHYIYYYFKPSIITGIVLLLTGLLLTFGLVYATDRLRFYEYITLNVFFQAIGLFIVIKGLPITNLHFIRIRDFINEQSYTVYLLHPLVLLVMIKCGITWHFCNPAVAIPISTFLCVTLSVGISWLLKQIPFIRDIT